MGQSIPRTPSDEEVSFHKLSHLPFQAWCPYCMACTGKQDPQRPVEPHDEDRRSIPSAQLDYCFSKAEEFDKVSTVLVAIGCRSKMVTVLPLPSKGNYLRGQVEHLLRFKMALNYMDNVSGKCAADAAASWIPYGDHTLQARRQGQNCSGGEGHSNTQEAEFNPRPHGF